MKLLSYIHVGLFYKIIFPILWRWKKVPQNLNKKFSIDVEETEEIGFSIRLSYDREVEF